MWVVPIMTSLQMRKHHRRAIFKGIPSTTTIHMRARLASNFWKYFTDSVSEEDI